MGFYFTSWYLIFWDKGLSNLTSLYNSILWSKVNIACLTMQVYAFLPFLLFLALFSTYLDVWLPMCPTCGVYLGLLLPNSLCCILVEQRLKNPFLYVDHEYVK